MEVSVPGDYPPAGYAVPLAIAAVFRDEAPYLREWIEYHRLVGVEHFYLVNDRSVDHYRAVLAPYEAAGVVDVLEYACPERHRGRGWIDYQRLLYDGLCRELAYHVEWLALIDVDEFLVPGDADDLVPDVLARHHDCGAIYVRWEPFGTSHVGKLDPAVPMTAQLCLKWRYSKGHDMLGKSIVRPDRVLRANIHRCELQPGLGEHDCNPGMASEYSELKLHHYWSRDEAYLRTIKLPRAAEIKGWDLAAIGDEYFSGLFNDVPDPVMLRYLDRLRVRLAGVP